MDNLVIRTLNSFQSLPIRMLMAAFGITTPSDMLSALSTLGHVYPALQSIPVQDIINGNHDIQTMTLQTLMNYVGVQDFVPSASNMIPILKTMSSLGKDMKTWDISSAGLGGLNLNEVSELMRLL